jgi:hypothetical protein
MSTKTGLRAVITGASSGIGEELARELARRGFGLVLAARRRERLDALASELRAAHGVACEIVAVDLATADGRADLDRLAWASGPVDMLINNAGMGDHTSFVARDWPAHERLLQINVLALAELSHRFARRMLARGARSYIVNVGSLVAHMPVPYFANYAASKAYVRGFSEALAAELAGSPVTVTCVSPGATRSEFSAVAGMRTEGLAERMMMSSQRVARIAVRAALAGRREVVTGWTNRLSSLLARLVPRRLAAWSATLVLGAPANARAPLPSGDRR